LLKIMRVTVILNLFMLAAEVFTQFYTGGAHVTSAQYLYFGLHGKHALVPWIWTAIFLNVTAAVMLLTPKAKTNMALLNTACVMTFVGVWIEKGMGLIIPGFIPSTLHELVEYVPSLLEWKVMVGIWAAGILIYTLLLKAATPILTDKARAHQDSDD
jgi:Ni/Fe-hydrogenase subunit HybB-like protein